MRPGKHSALTHPRLSANYPRSSLPCLLPGTAAALRDIDRITIKNDQEQAALRTQRLQDVINYRQENQRPSQTDAFNLERQDKEPEPEGEFGPASMRTFAGEVRTPSSILDTTCPTLSLHEY